MTTRYWTGSASAEWTNDANWTPTGAPMAGDTAIIGSGLTPGSDFVVLDTVSPAANVTIQLGIDGGTNSATLDLDNSNILKSVDIVTRGNAGDLPIPPGQTILARDANLLNGFLESAAFGEELSIVIGTTSNPGTFTVSSTATMLDGPESGTRILGDEFVNEGVMVVEGGLHIDNADFELSGAGQVIIQQGGTVTADVGAAIGNLDGAAGAFNLADGSATLVIDDLADFDASVKVQVSGARIEFGTLAANGVSYADGTLTLLEDGTTGRQYRCERPGRRRCSGLQRRGTDAAGCADRGDVRPGGAGTGASDHAGSGGGGAGRHAVRDCPAGAGVRHDSGGVDELPARFLLGCRSRQGRFFLLEPRRRADLAMVGAERH